MELIPGSGVIIFAEMGPGMPAQEDQDKEAEYRRHAIELLQLAESTQDAHERDTLVRMAEAWLQLASRMKELSEQKK